MMHCDTLFSWMYQFRKDPTLLRDVKKFLEVVELFEKRPDLFSTLRAAAEGTT
jgi:hypothetical protein